METLRNWTCGNVYHLSLLTLAYIIGEIAHFLINTTAREECFFNETFKERKDDNNCTSVKDQIDCRSRDYCVWSYSGFGYEYQVLAGPAFIAVFSVSGVLLSVLSDKLSTAVSRVVLVGLGAATFSAACVLMGFTSSYWQLVLLRMMISAGESVCRPMSSALIADLFTASARGVANGVFSWGVYLGFGLAFVLGINLTQANILGYGWRSAYVIAGTPGLIVAGLILLTLKDPRRAQSSVAGITASANSSSVTERGTYLTKLWRSFSQPSVVMLLLAAMARHTAGYAWAYNTRLYFQSYHPHFSLGYWILTASCVGGSFGVVAGGFFSDRLVARLGLPSRLWLLSICTILAAPLAALTLFLDPPAAMFTLIAYYLFAETWFAVLFTVIVEIVDPEVRATCIALFLFCMNLVGGNLPIIITPITYYLDNFRLALALVWPGCLGLSSLLFLLSSVPLHSLQKRRRLQLDTHDGVTSDEDITRGDTPEDTANTSTHPLLEANKQK